MKARPPLLVLNGSHSEIPLIQAAKRLGYEVTTTGNAPALIGHRFADHYLPADYSEPQAVLEVARRIGAEAIVSCANDFGIITAAEVCDVLGLPGHDDPDTVRLLHTKDRFKNLAIRLNLDSPPARWFDDLDQALAESPEIPVIVKPVDLTGGKGVARVHRPEDYRSAVTRALALSRAGRIVVEPLFQGSQHSLTTYLVDGRVVFHYCDNEYSHFNPFYVNASSSPVRDCHRHLPGLISNIERLAAELELVDGVFHVQYLARQEHFTIIDITRRCSGDLYPVPVSRATGLDWGEWIVRAETGSDCSGIPRVSQKGYHGRYCIMSHQTGRVAKVEISSCLQPFIVERLFWLEAQERIEDPLTQKVGMLFFEYPSRQLMDEMTARLPELVRIVLR